jgi:chemotaxis protein methyltransferase CheR
VNDSDCVAFLQWALPRMGLDWPGFRKVRRQVCKRLARRIAELGLADVHAYRSLLESNADEWKALAPLCTVTISRFYRDREVFDALGSAVLPSLARAALARGAARIECWSAGCGSGEEAYTLALQWRLQLVPAFPGLSLHVLGTDLDAHLLERARAACYPEGSLRELPRDWRARGFNQRARAWCVVDTCRAGVDFERQDLLVASPDVRFDLILCRNLAFTYFGPEAARRALERIEERLRPGGALVIGVHERLPSPAPAFEPWPAARATYRRAGKPAAG